MEIKIELDLQALIANAVAAEKIQPLLDKAISEAIKDSIQEATGYRSGFRDELKKQLSAAMPHGLGIDDVAKFQHMMNAAVTDAVHGENAKTIQAAMRAVAASVLPEVPSRIKLSDFLKEARTGFHKEDHEAFYAHLQISEYGGGWLYLDSDEDTKEKHRADMCIAFSKDGDVYSLRLDGANVTPKSMPNAVGEFDGLLLSMYVGRTSLDVDIDSDDVEYAAAEHND